MFATRVVVSLFHFVLMVVMSGFVLLFNRVVWRPLYEYSSRRLAM